MGYWLTMDAYPPRGAWVPYGFGMDPRFSDQISVPSGSAKRFWVVYTDSVVWHALTPYYRAYLSTLPLPPSAYPRMTGNIILSGQSQLSGNRLILSTPKIQQGRIKLRPQTYHGCITPLLPHLARPKIILSSPGRQSSSKIIWEGRKPGTPRLKWQTQSAVNGRVKWSLTITIPPPPGITIAQRAQGNWTTGMSVSASWPSATTTGNALIAYVATQTQSGFAGPATLTGPTGWTKINQVNLTGLGGGGDSSTWYYVNAPSQSGAMTWSYTDTRKAQCYIYEVQGVVSGGTVAIGAGTNGNFGPPLGSQATGTLPGTPIAVFAGFSGYTMAGNPAFTSPLSPYTIDQQYSGTGSTGGSCCLLKITSSNAGDTPTVSDSVSLINWTESVIGVY